jgi:hypothetical protein
MQNLLDNMKDDNSIISGMIGANVVIYGPWGMQRREVRSGESYGTCNSFTLHFGFSTVDFFLLML